MHASINFQDSDFSDDSEPMHDESVNGECDLFGNLLHGDAEAEYDSLHVFADPKLLQVSQFTSELSCDSSHNSSNSSAALVDTLFGMHPSCAAYALAPP